MSEVVSRVPLDALGEPHKVLGGMLEIRFTNSDGDTEVWMLPNEPDGPSFPSVLGLFRAEERVKLAYLDSGVDVRLSLLQKSLDEVREEAYRLHQELNKLYLREYGVPYTSKRADGA